MGTTSREIEGIDGDVEFYGSPQIVNVGIGQYEYWGHIEYDNRYEPELEEAEWDKSAFTKEQNDLIEEYLEDNLQSVCEDIIEDHDFEPDEPEERERDE